MKIYRLHPGLDAFEINSVFIPYLDIFANDEQHAVSNARFIIPDLGKTHSVNCISSIELINY